MEEIKARVVELEPEIVPVQRKEEIQEAILTPVSLPRRLFPMQRVTSAASHLKMSAPMTLQMTSASKKREKMTTQTGGPGGHWVTEPGISQGGTLLV